MSSTIPIPVARGKGIELIVQYLSAVSMGDEDAAQKLQKIIMLYLACCEEIVLNSSEATIQESLDKVNARNTKPSYTDNDEKPLVCTRANFFSMPKRTALSLTENKKARTQFKAGLTRSSKKVDALLDDPTGLQRLMFKLDDLLANIIGPTTEKTADPQLLDMVDAYVTLNNKILGELETKYQAPVVKRGRTNDGKFKQQIPSVLPPMPKEIS